MIAKLESLAMCLKGTIQVIRIYFLPDKFVQIEFYLKNRRIYSAF